MSTYSIFAVILFFLLWVVLNYSKFSGLSGQAQKIWNSCLPLLTQRYQLLPILINIAKNQASYDQNNLKALQVIYTQANDVRAVGKIQYELDKQATPLLANLLKQFQTYPELKTMPEFISIERQIISIESNLNIYKESYNALIDEYNQTLTNTVNQIFARVFRIQPKEKLILTVV